MKINVWGMAGWAIATFLIIRFTPPGILIAAAVGVGCGLALISVMYFVDDSISRIRRRMRR